MAVSRSGVRTNKGRENVRDITVHPCTKSEELGPLSDGKTSDSCVEENSMKEPTYFKNIHSVVRNKDLGLKETKGT